MRQKAVCGCLVEASRKSGERVAFQSLREEGGQKREEVQAARSPAIPDRGWSGTAHANLGARELLVCCSLHVECCIFHALILLEVAMGFGQKRAGDVRKGIALVSTVQGVVRAEQAQLLSSRFQCHRPLRGSSDGGSCMKEA